MVAISSSGIHFKDPWEFRPYTGISTEINIYDSAGTARTGATTAFFTEMARRGLQEQTNWTQDVYKTLLNVTSGKGLVAAIIGPTAGGASNTTFRFTIDGRAPVSITVSALASGERAMLLTAFYQGVAYTTANAAMQPTNEALDADKATFGALEGNVDLIPPWLWTQGIPLLKFERSILIEAAHSASITNSTATAYSAIMYRLGL